MITKAQRAAFRKIIEVEVGCFSLFIGGRYLEATG